MFSSDCHVLPQNMRFTFKKIFFSLFKNVPRNGFVTTSETFQALLEGKKTDLHSVDQYLGFSLRETLHKGYLLSSWGLPIREIEKIKLGA